MVMDGQGTALPTVLDYPVVEPVTVTAWVLVYSPHPANGSLAPGSLAPPPPPETALLSFGRPHPYPPDEKANCSTDDKSVVIAPAPGLHLSVGGTDEALRGRLFFGGAMDDKGRLTGFFSREPLPLNLWVHVALVLEPPAASLPEGAESRRPQAVVKGYIDGKVRLQNGEGIDNDVCTFVCTSASLLAFLWHQLLSSHDAGAFPQLQGRLAIDVSQLQAFNTTAPSNDPHARAVFLWGGVRARATAMMTGALQHAAIYVGHAFTDVRRGVTIAIYIECHPASHVSIEQHNRRESTLPARLGHPGASLTTSLRALASVLP